MNSTVVTRITAMRRGLSCGLGATAALLITLSGNAWGSDGQASAHAMHDHAMHDSHSAGQPAEHQSAPADDPHAHHRHMMHRKGYSRSVHDYRLPDLDLVGLDGNKTSLAQEVNCGKPVMLNFVFTTCTTICPVLSASFTQVQQEMGPEIEGVRMISITIDPEYDTPERLRAYAKRFEAGPQWQFLTGDLADIVVTQKAFDAYRGSKMNHEPVTFLRVADNEPWVRLNGIASASDIVQEYQQLKTN